MRSLGKTYDLGKKAAFREEHHLFDKDEIFGLKAGLIPLTIKQ